MFWCPLRFPSLPTLLLCSSPCHHYSEDFLALITRRVVINNLFSLRHRLCKSSGSKTSSKMLMRSPGVLWSWIKFHLSSQWSVEKIVQFSISTMKSARNRSGKSIYLCSNSDLNGSVNAEINSRNWIFTRRSFFFIDCTTLKEFCSSKKILIYGDD